MNEASPKPAIVLAALALLWCVGLFGRGYWTPDEPREAALAASVSAPAQALPSLGGVRFAEKPPLTYWLAGASMRVFGASPAAARAPQLAYALLAFVAALALTRALLGGAATGAHTAADTRIAALAGAAIFATSTLVYQVQIWLDTDALLLAGVAVALAGMYAALVAAGEDSTARRARWRGYLVMHAGLTLAFFAKNFAAWMVPVLAYFAFIAWERRWRELARLEFWLPALLPIACIALWVSAVAAQPDGARSLRILFWNNLVGRALAVSSEAQFNYASGHRSSPGQYFLELPLFLLPWTVCAWYAFKAAWRGARLAGPRRAAWRFALCAALPGLVVLSLAATARGIYAAPCMIGFVLLIILWAAEPSGDGAATRRAFAGTAALVTALALVVLGASAALQWSVLRAPWPRFALSAITAALVLVWSARQCSAPAPQSVAKSAPSRLLQFAIAWCLLLSLGVLGLFGAMNHTQDIDALAARVAQAAGPAPLLLWSPDETTLAWAQLDLPAGSWSAIDGTDPAASATLARRLRAAPDTVVASMAAGRWTRAAWLAYLRGEVSVDGARAASTGSEPLLGAAGLSARARVGRPGGRGYLLWRLQP